MCRSAQAQKWADTPLATAEYENELATGCRAVELASKLCQASTAGTSLRPSPVDNTAHSCFVQLGAMPHPCLLIKHRLHQLSTCFFRIVLQVVQQQLKSSETAGKQDDSPVTVADYGKSSNSWSCVLLANLHPQDHYGCGCLLGVNCQDKCSIYMNLPDQASKPD
jgi:hypothetical protein